jgi:plasmid stabilization system protein ParE
MKIIYTDRAADDLEALSAYLTPTSRQGARNVQSAILKTLANLSIFPHSGRLQTAIGVRKIGTRTYPYLIYYTVEDDAEEIIILTIQHAAREREFTDQ